MRSHILLSVGAQPELLRLRNAVLRNAGYYVHAETSVYEAMHLCLRSDFDLVILCHTIPEAEKMKLLTAIKTVTPSTPVIIARDSDTRTQADASVDSLDSPGALLSCVAGLLTRRRLAS